MKLNETGGVFTLTPETSGEAAALGGLKGGRVEVSRTGCFPANRTRRSPPGQPKASSVVTTIS